ncbi:MAG: HU family DNA-binding protein [Spirochaetes bacterium]|nr:HU family DNA-binding protein [Spirochaetota bacterium]HPA72650.1 HU family DNA-binding protein [Spirochaetota bacterium]
MAKAKNAKNGKAAKTAKMTKTQLVQAIVDQAKDSGMSRKQAAAALNALNTIVAKQLGRRGPGEITIPGIAKLQVIVKPAQPERKGINPFTKEPTIFKAKPARRVVKARILKGMKDAAM